MPGGKGVWGVLLVGSGHWGEAQAQSELLSCVRKPLSSVLSGWLEIEQWRALPHPARREAGHQKEGFSSILSCLVGCWPWQGGYGVSACSQVRT